MIKVCPFGTETFFFTKNDIVVYSTHPSFKVGDKAPDRYQYLDYTFYLGKVNEYEETTKEHLINYLKDNNLIEYLI